MLSKRTAVARFSIGAVLWIPAVVPAQQQQSGRVPVAEAVSLHYLAVAESALAAPQARAIWQKRLDAARDTLESVLAWNNAHDQRTASLRMLIALSRFWNGPTLVKSFDDVFSVPIVTDSAIQARALNNASAAAFRTKDQTKTRLWARRSIAISAAIGDTSGMGRAYQRLVQAALRDGDHASLRALSDTGQALCARVRNEDCQAYFLNMRGESARVLKQYDSAAVYYGQADVMYRRLSATRLDVAHNIGFSLLPLGNVVDARRRFVDALRIAAGNADRPYTAFMLAGLASCYAVEHKAIEAARLFGLFDTLLVQSAISADPADEVEYERYRSIARRQLGSEVFTANVQLGKKMSLDSVVASLR